MIVFRNPGVLDPRAITTFGVNVKESPASAIGFFGTGLKYAIAVLLRHGCTISINSGGENYTFDVGHVDIRGKSFGMVLMNGKEMGFTTELGKTWELWMAFRELYSNMLDEGGEASKVDDMFMPGENETVVMVDGAEFEEVYNLRDLYFLDKSRKAVHANNSAAAYEKVFESSDEGTIFYKGVRVGRTSGASIYDYNFTSGIDLTEDRTMKYPFQRRYFITQLWLDFIDTRNAEVLKNIIRMPDNEVMKDEHKLDFTRDFYGAPQPTSQWLDIVGELRKVHHDLGLNSTAIELHRKHREENVLPTESCQLNSVEQSQLNKARTFVKDTLEMDIDKYQCIISDRLANGKALGLADMENKVMYISKKCFAQGTKQVAAALVEEFTHLDTGCTDESFEQKWEYLSTILTLGERLRGEPL